MPANIAEILLQTMTNAMKELDKKMQESDAKYAGRPIELDGRLPSTELIVVQDTKRERK